MKPISLEPPSTGSTAGWVPSSVSSSCPVPWWKAPLSACALLVRPTFFLWTISSEVGFRPAAEGAGCGLAVGLTAGVVEAAAGAGGLVGAGVAALGALVSALAADGAAPASGLSVELALSSGSPASAVPDTKADPTTAERANHRTPHEPRSKIDAFREVGREPEKVSLHGRLGPLGRRCFRRTETDALESWPRRGSGLL
jgi:hypothetical protein